MDEREVEDRARRLVRQVGPTTLPVDVVAYAAAIGAAIKEDAKMAEGESGYSYALRGKRYIVVNPNEPVARRRFTVCHEIAHFALELPSEHGEISGGNSVKRAPNEIACDIFAAELLLPASIVLPLVRKADPGLDAIKALSVLANASFPCTGSRFAAFANIPCAFVFGDGGIIRSVVSSTPLRQARAWIDRGRMLAPESLAAILRGGAAYEGPISIDGDIWFSDWASGINLVEDARYDQTWDQSFSFVWFEDAEEISAARIPFTNSFEDEGLKELDGNLPWPGKRRRK